MLTELRGKGGTLCGLAREGKVRCPLIVRPTSEDVITGQLFQTLGCIEPRWWLADLLSAAGLGPMSRRRLFRRLRIELWTKRPPFPPEWLPWDEGVTEVDAVVKWENPPTTLYVEMKYQSAVATKTTHSHRHESLPADQLARNIRVGLHECGWYSRGDLFPSPPREFMLLLIAPERGHPLVARYRQLAKIWNVLPCADKLVGLPREAFVGEIAYREIEEILLSHHRFMSQSEQRLADLLRDYLAFKRTRGAPPTVSVPLAQAELF